MGISLIPDSCFLLSASWCAVSADPKARHPFLLRVADSRRAVNIASCVLPRPLPPGIVLQAARYCGACNQRLTDALTPPKPQTQTQTHRQSNCHLLVNIVFFAIDV